jgi:hypothetical protein
MRLVVLTLSLLFFPGVAFAAPAFAAIGAFLSSTAVVVAGVAISWGSIIFTAASMLYGQAQQRRQAKAAQAAASRQRADFNAGLRDKSVSGIATEFPYRTIYGEDKVGVNIAALFTTGDRDEFKHLICVFAQHECQSVDAIYINGKQVGTLDGNGYVTDGTFLAVSTQTHSSGFMGDVYVLPFTPSGPIAVVYEYLTDEGAIAHASAPFTVVGNTLTVQAGLPSVFPRSISYQYLVYTPRVQAKIHLGIPGDTVDATLNARIPSKWPSTSVLAGHAYIYLMLDLYQPEFQGSLPQIEVKVKGKKLYDPRDESTVWSQNNALVALDYLTGPLGGVAVADVPVAQFISAANDCDDSVSTGTWTGKRFTFNGSVTSDQSREDVLEKIAESMAGGIVATTWDIYAGKYRVPVMALTDADIVGEIAFSPGCPEGELFNTVKGIYMSAENGYVVTDYKPYKNTVYEEIDGQEYDTNIDLPFTNEQQRCTNLARIFMESNRNSFAMNGVFSLRTFKLKVGDRVTFTSLVFGQSGKVYRLTDRGFSPESFMRLGFKEDAESIYDLADATSADETPNSDLPNPFVIPSLTNLTVQSGTASLFKQADGSILSRAFLQWDQTTAQGVLEHGNIQVEYQEIGSTEWLRVTLDGDQVATYIAPLHDLNFYTFRIRASNPYVGAVSDWTYAPIHQVVGKTEPPENIIDLGINGSVLTWTPVAALDLAGYVFRFHYGNNLDWNSAVPLHTGLILASPFDLITRPGGVVTIMGKAIDTSGNESAATGNVFTDLGDPPIANVVDVFDLGAEGFPGEVIGGEVTSEGVEADATDSFYGTDNQSFYGLDADPFYLDTTYGQVQYISRDLSFENALPGSILTLILESEGTDLKIDYRLAGPDPFYGQDVDSFYGPDAESFYGSPGLWVPWPGQIVAEKESYQFRVTIGAGPIQGKLTSFVVTLDAPDLLEFLDDVLISASGTPVPYTKAFTAIRTVTPTLQANASGAETVETDKTIPLTPVVRAYNSSHVAVSGATADIILKGY